MLTTEAALPRWRYITSDARSGLDLYYNWGGGGKIVDMPSDSQNLGGPAIGLQTLVDIGYRPAIVIVDIGYRPAIIVDIGYRPAIVIVDIGYRPAIVS